MGKHGGKDRTGLLEKAAVVKGERWVKAMGRSPVKICMEKLSLARLLLCVYHAFTGEGEEKKRGCSSVGGKDCGCWGGKVFLGCEVAAGSPAQFEKKRKKNTRESSEILRISF